MLRKNKLIAKFNKNKQPAMCINNKEQKFINNNLNEIQREQNIKRRQISNNINRKYDFNSLMESLMPRINDKINDNNEKRQIDLSHRKQEEIRDMKNQQNIKELYRNRVNIPYKGIIKQENFDYNKEIKSPTDLCIYKITQKDKKVGRFIIRLAKLQNSFKKFDDKLRLIYSDETEDKKKFNYEHITKFKLAYNPRDLEDDMDVRDKYIEEFKKEQEKIEQNKKKIEQSIEELLENGILTNDELDFTLDYHELKINNDNNQKKIIYNKKQKEIKEEIKKEIREEIKEEKCIESGNNIITNKSRKQHIKTHNLIKNKNNIINKKKNITKKINNDEIIEKHEKQKNCEIEDNICNDILNKYRKKNK